MKLKMDDTATKTDTIEKQVDVLVVKCDVHDCIISSLESRLEKAETRWYSNNVMLCGVPEKGKDENCEIIATELFQSTGVICDDRSLQFAYRLGRYNKNKSRPIIVRLQHIKDRDMIWNNRKKLTDGLYIRAMYPPAIHRKRRILQAVSNYAESVPRYKGTTRVTYNNKVVVGKQFYGIDEFGNLPIDLQKPVATRSQGDITVFYGGDSPLSNFYPSTFIVDSISFSCNEQYYYYAKALYYGDYKAQLGVLATDDPVEIKRIGRSIDMGDVEWNKTPESTTAMRTGLLAKFTQNNYLRRVLQNTGKYILAEANPYDTTWGIGLPATDAKAFSKDQWSGRNQLGTLLMSVRDELSM
jgi:ribA/ribD-fused uncharacterized protein